MAAERYNDPDPVNLGSSELVSINTLADKIERIAGVKLKPVDGGTACRFMTDEGCSVYEDRPTACRYYPVAMVSMRKQDEYVDRDSYALVKEAHDRALEAVRAAAALPATSASL